MEVDLRRLHWRIINDGVMGGCSRSRLDVHEDHLFFHGELSTENRGGFVSVLARMDRPLQELTGFRLEASGDGRRYQLRLRESDSTRDVAWRAFFHAGSRPSHIAIDIGEFHPVMRGQPAIGARPLESTPVRYLGFMLTSRRPGSFELKVHSLEAFGKSGD
jgi:monofunctional biosynthetic peptidoglycan transglycosylase